jgi:beta-galactosidase
LDSTERNSDLLPDIQADFVGIDDIGEYPMIYLPYPEMLRRTTADKLRDYVSKGGKLISEGCPGYFGDGGKAGTVQPNLGLCWFGVKWRAVVPR